MNVEIQRLSTAHSDHDHCYVHARGLILPDGFGLITTQKLLLSQSDVFYGIEQMKSTDGGRSFSSPVPCETLRRKSFADGSSVVMCDATPFYHKHSDSILLTGHTARYGANNKLAPAPQRRNTAYAVYDRSKEEFGPLSFLDLPEEEFFNEGAGCCQILEGEQGELWIPTYFKSRKTESIPNSPHSTAVLRCSFDGKIIRVLECSNQLVTPKGRGLGEPSLVFFEGEYLLTLRNDLCGYVSKSRDGLHYSPIQELCFDNGESLGNYNTQQHWITLGGKLYLVYTRKAGNNDHIFRHRAPLFMAEFDAKNLCVIRDTEIIVVPERGARLGNFGCQSYSENTAYVFASEWMQNYPLAWEGCAKYGSDNSIFITKLQG